MKKDSKGVPARLFTGLSLLDGEHGVRVEEVPEAGPAAAAGLAPGDVVLAVGGRSVGSGEEFLAALGPGVALEFQRGHGTHTVEIHAIDLHAPGGIEGILRLGGGTKHDRRCDPQCNCTRKVSNSVCETRYLPKGNGPRGGVLLEKQCVFSGLPPGDPPQSAVRTCGTKEYF